MEKEKQREAGKAALNVEKYISKFKARLKENDPRYKELEEKAVDGLQECPDNCNFCMVLIEEAYSLGIDIGICAAWQVAGTTSEERQETREEGPKYH